MGYIGFHSANYWLLLQQKKSKAIPVTGRGSLRGCEVLKIPLCLDNWLTDSGKIVSLTHWPRSTPQKILNLENLPAYNKVP
jgi:hypothetical protein